ncbi:MAG TPA: hypothetical protein VLG13_02565 [Patescibacteria group bacterium]|nr:hypothetical protein [Patescibacteria group bacterium]
MPALVHNLGLELPVFDKDTRIAWGHQDIAQGGDRKADTLIRRTRFRALGATSLREALHAADALFQMAAAHAGATVVGHSWGLYHAGRGHPQYFGVGGDVVHPPLLPAGHVLVAEVDILRYTNPLRPSQKETVDKALETYSKAEQANSQFKWVEACSSQFVTAKEQPGADAQLWLIDIEPILERIG